MNPNIEDVFKGQNQKINVYKFNFLNKNILIKLGKEIKFMKKNKKIFYILIIILIIILGIVIYKNMIKKSKNGNNMSSQEIVDYILNVNSYKANVIIQVNSNKNKNKYILNQEYNTENGSIQEVVEPGNIAGVKIIRKNGNLKIENTTLNLSTIFENYQGLGENCLDLCTFIDDYKKCDKSSFEENDAEIIMKTKNDNKNKYTENKILYINKEDKLPTKLIIEDNNQNMTINIQYNKIEINQKMELIFIIINLNFLFPYFEIYLRIYRLLKYANSGSE